MTPDPDLDVYGLYARVVVITVVITKDLTRPKGQRPLTFQHIGRIDPRCVTVEQRIDRRPQRVTISHVDDDCGCGEGERSA